jgi:radical SAM protein with 4Fe4S-binding SPASM domain
MSEQKDSLLNHAINHYRQFGAASLVSHSLKTSKSLVQAKYSGVKRYTNKKLVYPHLRFITPKLEAANLELTNACNLHCKMCSIHSIQNPMENTSIKERRKVGFMSKDLFYKAVDELSQLKLNELYLHYGGESLLHPNFEEFLRYACNARVGGVKTVGWVDNGMLFNRDIADLVISLDVDLLCFSVDGLGEVNDRIRLGSNYDEILQNITYLVSHRRNGKPSVVINTVDCDKTPQEIAAFLKVWTKLADCVFLAPTNDAENALEAPNVYYDGYSTKLEPYCPYPFINMAVSWDGKVTGCCSDSEFALNLGDANKESLSDIWKGKEFRRLRKQLTSGNLNIHSPCFKCNYWRRAFTQQSQIQDGMRVCFEGYKKKYVAIDQSKELETIQIPA